MCACFMKYPWHVLLSTIPVRMCVFYVIPMARSLILSGSRYTFIRAFVFMNFCDSVVVFANASIRVLFSHSLIHVCAHMLCLCVCICSSILADCLYFCVRMCMLTSVPLSVCISASGYACILGVCFLFLFSPHLQEETQCRPRRPY